MNNRTVVLAARPAAALAAPLPLFALALASTGCSGSQNSADSHPATFEAAKALAASRHVPLLVDFYSPT